MESKSWMTFTKTTQNGEIKSIRIVIFQSFVRIWHMIQEKINRCFKSWCLMVFLSLLFVCCLFIYKSNQSKFNLKWRGGGGFFDCSWTYYLLTFLHYTMDAKFMYICIIYIDTWILHPFDEMNMSRSLFLF